MRDDSFLFHPRVTIILNEAWGSPVDRLLTKPGLLWLHKAHHEAEPLENFKRGRGQIRGSRDSHSAHAGNYDDECDWRTRNPTMLIAHAFNFAFVSRSLCKEYDMLFALCPG